MILPGHAPATAYTGGAIGWGTDTLAIANSFAIHANASDVNVNGNGSLGNSTGWTAYNGPL